MALKEDILVLRSEGLTYKQIVEKLNCAKSTVSYYCGIDQSSKRATRQENRRLYLRTLIQGIKEQSPCMDCKKYYPYWIMDFDHRPDEVKLFHLSDVNMVTSVKALHVEIAKCDIVCANCHRQRTWERLYEN